MEQENQKERVQEQKDNTPKWKKAVAILIAIGSCATIIAPFIDSLGQCIKNNNYTKNYKERLDADFADKVRRDQYNRNSRNNG